MNCSYISNKGKRDTNQDVVFIKNLGVGKDLYLLADGMGGYKNGEYAANFIIENLYALLKNQKSFDHNTIQSGIDLTTRALAKENKRLGSNMGATLGGIIRDKEVLHCFWVGDVKIFHISDKKMIFESIEHNLKNELIENKVFVEAYNAKKYNHIVTRSIQNDINKAKIDYKCIEDFEEGDYVILASDGVTDVFSNHQLLDVINSEQDVENKLSEIDDSLLKIAKDNYSLIIMTK